MGRVDPDAKVIAGVGVPVVVTGKVKAVPDGDGVCGRTGDDRSLGHRQVEGLDGVGGHPVGGLDGKLVDAGATDEVPARVAVPLPLSVRVAPVGRVDPDAKVIAGVGVPVVVTGKVKAVPDEDGELPELVIVGGPWSPSSPSR